MKRLFTLIAAVIIATTVWAQSPHSMSYQAVIRDASNKLLVNQPVGMQISILQGSSNGTTVYTETQKPGTNANGLVSIEIGGGAGFSAIDWTAGPYFIKTETDPTGGANYTITGTSQLLSVPYALHAKFAENYTAKEKEKLAAISGTNTGDQDLSGYATTSGATASLALKVDKEAGKGLSTEDYSAADKTKLAAISGTNTGDQDLSGYATTSATTAALNQKVDKVTGKGLSTEDYSAADKTKLAAISGTNTGDQDLSGYVTTSAATASLALKVDKEAGKGLSTEDYSAADKTKLTAVSGTNTGDQDLSGYATTSALNLKVDKEAGKGLSTEDYSTADKTKLAGLSTTAVDFSGNLAGDVTGIQSATLVSVVGGQSAANVAAATALTNSATNANAAGSIVKRDASGNFIAGTITADVAGNLTGNVTGNATSATTAQALSAQYVDWNATTGPASIANKPTIPVAADGSETKVIAGTNISVTGSGTTATPYVINAIPAMTAVQRDALTPVAGLMIYNSTTNKPNYYNGTGWMNYDGTSATTSFVCGNNLTITHTASDGVSPVSGSITYGTVSTSLTGAAKCWITQNLGATAQASSATDASAASGGWYWQFNRKQGFAHDGTTLTPATTWITSISETSDWLAANDPCTLLLGATWRLPTYTEWTAADATGWTTYTATYNSVLKIHAAGNLDNATGGLYYRGTIGYYWSSTQVDGTSGYNLALNGSNSLTSNSNKDYGLSVRCLRD